MSDTEPATQKQVNRLYAVLHSLNIDPKEFKKEHNISNLQDFSRRQISDWIDTLEAEEAATNDTPQKSKNMEECIKGAIWLVDTYILSEHVDDNTRAQSITQIAIELRREER